MRESNILYFIEKDVLDRINQYVSNVKLENFYTFNRTEEVKEGLGNFLGEFLDRINYYDMENLRCYTGPGFMSVNNILRGVWDYDKNGRLTDDILDDGYRFAKDLRHVLLKAPKLPFNIKTYRGVNLDAFYSYGITCLEDLNKLQDSFLYEAAFTSTSAVRDTSFFVRKSEWGNTCNIEIECLVPRDSEDGVLLLDSSISGSVSLNEFLINSSSLFKVLNVWVDKYNNLAKIQIMLIPQVVWNIEDYRFERSSGRTF